MIQFAWGGFGAGKSYHGMRRVRSEHLEGFRPICTNLAIHEAKLARYYAEKYPKSDVCVHQRTRILTDEEVGEFMLHRVSTNALWYDIPAPDKEAEKRGARPDWTRIRDNGILFIIEEAHEFFNSYSWQEIGRAFRAYKNQNRKFSDDILFITPSLMELDKQLRMSGQLYTHLTNAGQRKISGIVVPQAFIAREYFTFPGPSSQAMTTTVYTLEKDLADCYDTARGVRGVQGKKADINSRPKGIQWWWLIVAFVAFISLVLALMLYLQHEFKLHMLHKVALENQTSQNVRSSTSVNVAENVVQKALQNDVSSDQAKPGSPGVGQSVTNVVCVGWVKVENEYLALMSDGETYSSASHELDWIEARKISILGKVYPIVKREPSSSYVPPDPVPVVLPSVVPRIVNQADVTVIGRRDTNLARPQSDF